jgi:hypothetical protein
MAVGAADTKHYQRRVHLNVHDSASLESLDRNVTGLDFDKISHMATQNNNLFDIKRTEECSIKFFANLIAQQ